MLLLLLLAAEDEAINLKEKEHAETINLLPVHHHHFYINIKPLQGRESKADSIHRSRTPHGHTSTYSKQISNGGRRRQEEAFHPGGLCHGAWCWYKVATALRAAGHRVTALDLAASGAHPARLDEVASFEEYSRPLLDAVAAAAPGGERLVLVGHSHGGLSLALAMERFPRKVAAAVFVAAVMPCVGKHMGVTTEEVRADTSQTETSSRYGSINTYLIYYKNHIFNLLSFFWQFMRRTASKGLLMDCQTVAINSSNCNNGVAIVMGPRFMEEKYYQESPAEVHDVLLIVQTSVLICDMINTCGLCNANDCRT